MLSYNSELLLKLSVHFFLPAMANECRSQRRRAAVFLFSMEVTLILQLPRRKSLTRYATHFVFKLILSWFSLFLLTLSWDLRWKRDGIDFVSRFHERPQGKSYLFFTQFKAEIKGAKIEYATAYVSVPPEIQKHQFFMIW